MDINNIDPSYTNFLARTAAANSALDSLKNTKGNVDDEKMMNACKEFESYLLEMVMKEVTKSTNLFGLNTESSDSAMSLIAQNAKDTMLQTAASKLTEGGELGIAQKLYEAMKQQASMKTWDEIQAEKKAEDAAEATASAAEEIAEAVTGANTADTKSADAKNAADTAENTAAATDTVDEMIENALRNGIIPDLGKQAE